MIQRKKLFLANVFLTKQCRSNILQVETTTLCKALDYSNDLYKNNLLFRVSRKPQYKDVYRRRIEIAERARIFKVNYCLMVHNAQQKPLSSISG